MTQFDFGKNWADFSENALTSDKVEQAKQDFADLMDGIDLRGKSAYGYGKWSRNCGQRY